MALDDDAKRRAVSAVAAVRDDIHRVITTGSTQGYDVFGQPQLHLEPGVPEIPWVERWREERQQDALTQGIRPPQRDIDAPGE